MSRLVLRVAVLAIAVFVVGCGEKPPTAPDTGARETAETFFGALIASDPSRAYATLDPDSTRRVSGEQFAGLARTYLKNVGFPAEKVHIHASEEQGDAATVHVTLTGRGAGHTRRYSDGVTLRRTDGQWRVILPVNFGHKSR